MKIGYLNPWKMAAENQAYSSLAAAASRIGHELLDCSSSEDVERYAPDFVLASASVQPKLTDVPHYGLIHEPRDVFFTQRSRFHNLLSYDGYLTISDSLHRFLTDLTHGIGRSVPIGYCYTTCQRNAASADIPALIAKRALKITYFGTNWDKRRQNFFHQLSYLPDVQICGPEHSWPQILPAAYGGSPSFDGNAVQERYAANGIGLCMLSNDHLRDDIISNRVFEITSVGAIAFCCDVPWLRKHFGDSVYYFQQNLPDRLLRRAIAELRDEVYRNPEAAIEKARRARSIFETKFAAEVMMQNAVDYHLEVSRERAAALRVASAAYTPVISVIIRCGSRPIEFVQRAVDSIAAQTYGAFELILVRHHELDLADLENRRDPRIRSVRIVECPGGNRSASLWAGLRAVQGEYFAVLDDDDWWMSDHFEKLFRRKPSRPISRFFAFSGVIVQNAESSEVMGGAPESRAIHSMGFAGEPCWRGAISAFASNCFIASRDLLNDELLIDPQMDTAEDSYLIASLLAQADPEFSHAATSVFDRAVPHQSGAESHPRRFEDEMTWQLRIFDVREPVFLRKDRWAELASVWSKRPLPDLSPFLQEAIREHAEQVGSGVDVETSILNEQSHVTDPESGKAVIRPELVPWSYGAQLTIRQPERPAPQYQMIIELIVHKGTVGVGLLNPAADDFLFRNNLAANQNQQTVEWPLRDLSKIGRLVIQNWANHGESEVELLGIRLLADSLY